DDDATAIVCPQPRSANVDVFHRSFVLVVNDLITDAERMRDENQNAREEILEDVLERESHRDAANSKCANQISSAEPGKRGGEGEDNADEDNARMRKPPESDVERAVGAVGVCRSRHSVTNETPGEIEEEHDENGEHKTRDRRDKSAKHQM